MLTFSAATGRRGDVVVLEVALAGRGRAALRARRRQPRGRGRTCPPSWAPTTPRTPRPRPPPRIALGCTDREIARGLAAVRPVGRRLRLERLASGVLARRRLLQREPRLDDRRAAHASPTSPRRRARGRSPCSATCSSSAPPRPRRTGRSAPRRPAPGVARARRLRARARAAPPTRRATAGLEPFHTEDMAALVAWARGDRRARRRPAREGEPRDEARAARRGPETRCSTTCSTRSPGSSGSSTSSATRPSASSRRGSPRCVVGLLFGPLLHRAAARAAARRRRTSARTRPSGTRRRPARRRWAARSSCSRVTVSTLLFADLANRFVWAALLVTLGYGVDRLLPTTGSRSRSANSKGLAGKKKLVFQVARRARRRTTASSPTGTSTSSRASPGCGGQLRRPAPHAALRPDPPVRARPRLALPAVHGVRRRRHLERGEPHRRPRRPRHRPHHRLGDDLPRPLLRRRARPSPAFSLAEYLRIAVHPGRGGARRLLPRHLRRRHRPSSGTTPTRPRCSWATSARSPSAAALGMLAVLTKNEVACAILHGVFLAETRRASSSRSASFKHDRASASSAMAPIHHHFELKGLGRAEDHRALLDHLHPARARRAHVAQAAVARPWTAPSSPGRRSPSSGSRGAASPRRACCAREGARVTVTDRRPPPSSPGRSPRSRGAGVALRARRPRPRRLHRRGPRRGLARRPARAPGARRRRAPPACPVRGEIELGARFLAGRAARRRSPARTARARPPRSPAPCSRATGAPSSAATSARRSASTSSPARPPTCVVLELSSLPARGRSTRLRAARRRPPERHPRPPRPLPRRGGLRRGQGAPLRAPAAGRLRGRERARPARAGAWRRASRGDVLTFGFGPPAPAAARDPGGEPGPPGAELGSRSRPARRSATGVAQPRAARPAQPRERDGRGRSAPACSASPATRCRPGSTPSPACPTGSSSSRERGGVEWVNDSKATNVDSTAVGLSAFPAGRPRVVLVMGGRGKGAPYAPLRPLFAGRVKALLTIGEDAPRVRARARRPRARPTPAARSPPRCRARAALAGPGDVVLLSPACAELRSVPELRGARRGLPPRSPAALPMSRRTATRRRAARGRAPVRPGCSLAARARPRRARRW